MADLFLLVDFDDDGVAVFWLSRFLVDMADLSFLVVVADLDDDGATDFWCFWFWMDMSDLVSG
ncbi:MAG: hypothetical protein ACLQVI_06575 [Polyangiaceae bacterium]